MGDIEIFLFLILLFITSVINSKVVVLLIYFCYFDPKAVLIVYLTILAIGFIIELNNKIESSIRNCPLNEDYRITPDN